MIKKAHAITLDARLRIKDGIFSAQSRGIPKCGIIERFGKQDRLRAASITMAAIRLIDVNSPSRRRPELKNPMPMGTPRGARGSPAPTAFSALKRARLCKQNPRRLFREKRKDVLEKNLARDEPQNLRVGNFRIDRVACENGRRRDGSQKFACSINLSIIERRLRFLPCGR